MTAKYHVKDCQNGKGYPCLCLEWDMQESAKRTSALLNDLEYERQVFYTWLRDSLAECSVRLPLNLVADISDEMVMRYRENKRRA